MSTSAEEFSDPFDAHFRRDPLPDAGVRVIVLLTDLPTDGRGGRSFAGAIICRRGRAVETAIVATEEQGSERGAEPRARRAPQLRWCWSRPPREPWTAAHLDPLLEAIDHCDHVIGRRPAEGWRSGSCRWLGRLALAADLRRAGARRPLAVPPAPPREAGGDPPAVGLGVPRRRDPGQGDLLRPLDRRGRRPAARRTAAAGRGRLGRSAGGCSACRLRRPRRQVQRKIREATRAKVTTAQAARMARARGDVEPARPLEDHAPQRVEQAGSAAGPG